MSTVEELIAASRNLGIDERLRLAEAIWESVVADDSELESHLSAEQRDELHRRWAGYLTAPDRALTREQARTEMAALRPRP